MESISPFASNPIRTRDDVAQFLVGLLNPLERYTSPGGAFIKVGETATHFDERAAQIEGFARPLWGLASLLAGGFDYPGTSRWASGFRTGPDPTNVEWWGDIRDRDQRMVECSPIGFALAVAGKHFWAPLSEKEKTNLEEWLGGMNDKAMPNTNWLWFRVFANLGLLKVGSQRASRERMEADLDHLDTFFIPNSSGWSRDGPEGVLQLDYYSSSYAIQFAQLVYSKIALSFDPERCKKYKERACAFALDFIHYFDPEGRAIPFGRSNTYRFAQSSFWGALAFAGLTEQDLPAPLNWGVVKGLQLRNLRYWAHQSGAYTKDGVVTIGYNYPNMYMTDNYNSPGSPYWCCKSFISLALPPDHPFWLAEEQPIPYHSPPFSLSIAHPLPTPMHIIISDPIHTYLLSSGQMCSYLLKASSAKYGKFAYSSSFGCSFPTGTGTLEELGGDNAIAIANSEDLGHLDGEFWRTRRVVENARIEYSETGQSLWLRSVWRPFKDVEIETFLVPPVKGCEFWHLRVHCITFAAGSTRDLTFAEGGWATYGQGKDERAIGMSAYWSAGSSGFDSKVPEGVLENEEGRCILAASAGGVVGIADLSPLAKRQRRAVKLDPNSNIIWSRAICPTLVDRLAGAGEGDVIRKTWHVTGVFGLPFPQGRSIDWEQEWSKRPVVPDEINALMGH